MNLFDTVIVVVKPKILRGEKAAVVSAVGVNLERCPSNETVVVAVVVVVKTIVTVKGKNLEVYFCT